jgi:AraC-like DNA-binding protein
MELLSLGLNQLQAAKYEYSPRHVCDWSANPRPFSTIALMQEGGGRFVIAEENFEVNSRQAFFIPAGSKYKSYWQGREKISYLAIHFHFDNQYFEFAPQRFRLQKLIDFDPKMFLYRFEHVRRYGSKSGPEKLKAYGAFYELYAELAPLLELTEFKNDDLKSVEKAVIHLEHHSEKAITVKELAQLCHLSESRFYALFKRALGCSPIAYRNSVRIRKAMTLLGGKDRIDEVATKVGFSSSVHFRQVFKEITGKLPSEYQKNLRF